MVIPPTYSKRHGVEFDGFSIPDGRLLDFRPPDVVLKKDAKFCTISMPGMFIGYTQHVGGEWAHDYLVLSVGRFSDRKRFTHMPYIQNLCGNSRL